MKVAKAKGPAARQAAQTQARASRTSSSGGAGGSTPAPSHIFVDETKRAGYVIADVTVNDTEARPQDRACSRAARSAADPH